MNGAGVPAPVQAIVVMGVSGSGKSLLARALAEHYGARYLDADDFHSAQARARMASGQPLTDAMRAPWVDALAAALRDHANRGETAVLAFSGLRAAHREQLRAGSGLRLLFLFLQGEPGLIAQRLSARTGHFMPPALLDSQFEALQAPEAEPDVLAIDISPPPAQVIAAAIAAIAAGCAAPPCSSAE
ncbi:gluconokinase [Pseudoxanthomonas wuyuanensis]|uniref:Gluconokinase n=1 Tax=Pseudoxanthomonas wuyuanensis TaxID=1073196 RepID=A0A286D8D9_9GAMM|nr:gluconokinase [Pseudoxanthomonas wuyuanensis]KAF1716121.1 gluconokinase [Pseudoxanthomonas wuyuanensis]SOD54932.1 gluconate kinase, SKI family [Pseudoxanthomonas wuyuanensis]